MPFDPTPPGIGSLGRMMRLAKELDVGRIEICSTIPPFDDVVSNDPVIGSADATECTALSFDCTHEVAPVIGLVELISLFGR